MADEADTQPQAQALLNAYYKEQGLKGEPNLLSWNLHDDGTMVLVDGTSGRKLTFAPELPAPAPSAASTPPPAKAQSPHGSSKPKAKPVGNS